MSDFQRPDTKALQAELENIPLETPLSSKGQFFNLNWWRTYHAEVEKMVLAILEENIPSFDKRVNIMLIAQKVDTKNELSERGFTPTEITRYVTRAMNKRLRQISGPGNPYYVIRNQKLVQMALEDKSQ